jgi:hypothetical protein
MAKAAAGKPAGEQVAEAPANTPEVVAPAATPPAVPAAGFAANHPLPPGFLRLVCPVGAETGPISAAGFSGEAFREHGPGRGRWLFDCPREAAVNLIRTAGFRLFDPADPP